MKKATIFVTTIILALTCISLAGCTKPGEQPKTSAYSASATTVAELNGAKASDYNDGYHTDDYFVVVTLTTTNVATIPVLNTETNAFNFILLMSNGSELLAMIKPIKDLCAINESGSTVYTLVFHSNYKLTDRTFDLSIALGNGEYKILTVR